MSEQLPPNPTPQESPATDPSMLGGNVTPPFDEEVYKQKVVLLEGALQEQTTAHLTAQREVFVKAVGGHREAERVDVWEAVKKNEARRAYGEVTDILAEESSNAIKPEEEKDVFDKVVTSVTLDMRGTTDLDRVQAGPDVVDFNVGSELDGLVDTGELQDPAVLAKATKTMRLLVADGQYKLNKWGNADQLKTALGLVETYTEWVPDFNPKEAGFDEAKAGLTMSLAALQVDQSSKPNYQYAKPERNYLFAQTADGLKQLRTTEAHMSLRYQDFELPQQPATDQPEAS
jgi:hypothetical protein